MAQPRHLSSPASRGMCRRTAAEGAIFTGVPPEMYYYRVNAVALKDTPHNLDKAPKIRYNIDMSNFMQETLFTDELCEAMTSNKQKKLSKDDRFFNTLE